MVATASSRDGAAPRRGGSECWNTRGFRTETLSTEEAPDATATTVCRYRLAPPTLGDRAYERGRPGARRGPSGQRPGRVVDGGRQGRTRPGRGPGEHLRRVMVDEIRVRAHA